MVGGKIHVEVAALLETGVDIIEVARIEEAVARHGRRFIERVYTPEEVAKCAGRAQSLAVRFAAKEAAIKVLGQRVAWREVEVVSEPSGKPVLRLHGRAKRIAGALRAGTWSVSLSHTGSVAVAVVVAGD